MTNNDKFILFQQALTDYTYACMTLYSASVKTEPMRDEWHSARVKLLQLYDKELKDERTSI